MQGGSSSDGDADGGSDDDAGYERESDEGGSYSDSDDDDGSPGALPGAFLATPAQTRQCFLCAESPRCCAALTVGTHIISGADR